MGPLALRVSPSISTSKVGGLPVPSCGSCCAPSTHHHRIATCTSDANTFRFWCCAGSSCEAAASPPSTKASRRGASRATSRAAGEKVEWSLALVEGSILLLRTDHAAVRRSGKRKSVLVNLLLLVEVLAQKRSAIVPRLPYLVVECFLRLTVFYARLRRTRPPRRN